MIIERLTVKDLNSVLKLLPEGKYDKTVSELIADIRSDGFKFKVVDENGSLLAGFIANYTEGEEGYIVEVFNNKSLSPAIISPALLKTTFCLLFFTRGLSITKSGWS